ncbi:MAG TPA: CPBP family intramembrane glutamic endopeptidase [Pyrinomonadaceae bacterium]|nr:CPBP family intramembrane glutamic endopeptidase [Pyrinomonadaceae bacterium]
MEIEEKIVDQPFVVDQPSVKNRLNPSLGAGPNNPPWGAVEAVGLWIASVLFILIVPTIFLLPYLATRHPRIADPDQLIEFAKSDPMAVFLQIAAILPAHLFTIAVAWLIVTRFKKFDFREMIGWRSGGFRWWQYAVVLIGFGLIAVAASSIYPEQDNDLLKIVRSSRSAVYILAFVATFTAPFVEEVVYRGVLYSAFQRAMGVPAAFLVVTLMFSLVHVPQYWPSYTTIFLLTLLSLILTTIRVKTNNLLPCIIFHTLFNGLQSIMLIAEPYLQKPETQAQAALFLRLFH